jgi:hypothetical protein
MGRGDIDMEICKHEEMETWRHGHGILMFYEKIKQEMENGNPANFP